MKHSTDCILTTHVGSLPRPQPVVDMLFAQDRGDLPDQRAFDDTMREAVADVVRKQAEVGIDVVSDGEMSKISYAPYIRHRLSGFEPGHVPRATPKDLDEYPDYRDRLAQSGGTPKYLRPVCKGAIAVKDMQPLARDITHLQAAIAASGVAEGFLNKHALLLWSQITQEYVHSENYMMGGYRRRTITHAFQTNRRHFYP